MKLMDIASKIEINYLLKNELIEPEHVDAEVDESYFVEDATNEGSGSTCLRYLTMQSCDELVVWIHSNFEPQAWVPGENGHRSFDRMKKDDLGDT